MITSFKNLFDTKIKKRGYWGFSNGTLIKKNLVKRYLDKKKFVKKGNRDKVVKINLGKDI